MSRSLDPKFVLIAAALLAAGGLAHARSSDRNKPMEIEASRSDCGLGSDASCTLTGNVIITQGTLRVVAAKAVVQQNDGDPSRALLSGGVSLRQELDDGGMIDAKSANVDYNLRNEVVIFTGNVEITQARGTLTGERVVYNMKTGQLDSGGEGNGRVKMRILPKGSQAQDNG